MAKGSQKRWGHPGQPRVCGVCGGKCRLHSESLHLREYPRMETFHARCLPSIVGVVWSDGRTSMRAAA